MAECSQFKLKQRVLVDKGGLQYLCYVVSVDPSKKKRPYHVKRLFVRAKADTVIEGEEVEWKGWATAHGEEDLDESEMKDQSYE